MLFTTKNKKLSKDNIAAFNLPPIKTCPGAKECLKYCYLKKGNFLYPNVKAGQETRHKASLSPCFESKMINEVMLLNTKHKVKYFRLHVSGDIYSKAYLVKLCNIAKNCPSVTFYAYTKSVKLVKDNAKLLPKNFRIIFSYGGRYDNLINPKIDNNCIVINKGDKTPKGYHIGNTSDMIAIKHKNIALIKH